MMRTVEPGRVASVDGTTVRVMTDAGLQDAELTLLLAQGESLHVGDWVVVSPGLVLRRVSEREGRLLFDERSTARNRADRVPIDLDSTRHAAG
jgi:hydrogenase maturation factor